MRSLRAGPALLLAVALAAVLGGCGRSSADAPPTVQLVIGDQKVSLKPTQYCDGKDFHRYDVQPPVIAAAPGTRITFTVPASVATHGWTVQVYDQQLEERIGQAPVPAGQRSFDQITMSDPAPSAFYLVVVEKETAACHELAGSWPAGFIRVQTGSGSASASVSQAG